MFYIHFPVHTVKLIEIVNSVGNPVRSLPQTPDSTPNLRFDHQSYPQPLLLTKLQCSMSRTSIEVVNLH